MPTDDPNLDGLLYLKLLTKPFQLYYMGLEPCCKRAFREADKEQDGTGPSAFDCPVHKRVDVSMDSRGPHHREPRRA